MTISLPLDSASHLLNASNVIYVVGAVLTLGSAAMVLYEKHSRHKGIELRWGMTTEIVVVIAAFISLAGTFGAIGFGNTVSKIKDADLKTYQKQADLLIAQANKDAAQAKKDAASAISNAGAANQNAQDARLKADKTEMDNSKLRIDVTKANSDLAAQTEKVNQFAQGVAQQQQGMAHQMQATPSMNDQQVQFLGSQLKGFAGQKVSVHSMLDARANRLGGQFTQAFQVAGLIDSGNSTDVGPNYTGVMVAVHDASPLPHPPLADAILNTLSSMGIPAHGTAYPIVPPNEVWILIGPE